MNKAIYAGIIFEMLIVMEQTNIYHLQVGDKVVFTNQYNYTIVIEITRITDKSIFSGRRRNSINYINTLIRDGAKIINQSI